MYKHSTLLYYNKKIKNKKTRPKTNKAHFNGEKMNTNIFVCKREEQEKKRKKNI